jgi:hypothetical protein
MIADVKRLARAPNDVSILRWIMLNAKAPPSTPRSGEPALTLGGSARRLVARRRENSKIVSEHVARLGSASKIRERILRCEGEY